MSRFLLILVTTAIILQNSAQSQSCDYLRDGYQLYENVKPNRDDKTSGDLTADSDEFGYETNIERNTPLIRKKLKQKTYLDNSDTSLSSTELRELLESISIPPSLLPSKHKATLNQQRKQQIDTLKFGPLIMKLYDKTNPNSYKYDKMKLAKIKDTNSQKSKYIKHLDRPDYKPDYRPGFRPGHRPGHRPWHRPGHRPGPPYRPEPRYIHGNNKPKQSHVIKSDAKFKKFRFPKFPRPPRPPRPPKPPKPPRPPKPPTTAKPTPPDLDYIIYRPPPDDYES